MNGHGEVVVKHFDDLGHQVGSPLFVNTDVEHEQPSSDRSLDGDPGERVDHRLLHEHGLHR
jgi:hypothetical protein